MKLLIFGATGMIGQAAMLASIADPAVTEILIVARSQPPKTYEKTRVIIHKDFNDYTALTSELSSVDACIFCLGVSSVGMDEGSYRAITYGYTMAAARALAAANPAATFVYVSAAGADSSTQGKVMWARVRGEVERDLQRLGLRGAYSVRPGYVQPADGITSRTPLYRAFYVVLGALYPLWRLLAPRHTITTREMGQAMLRLARSGGPLPVLECSDMRALIAA